MPTRSGDTIVATLALRYGDAPFAVTREGVAGFTYDQLRLALDAGLLTRVRRGVLAVTSELSDDEPVRASAAGDDEAALAVARRANAVLRCLPPEAVVSHESAAVVHGLWLPVPADGDLHITVPGQSERRDGGVRIHGTASTRRREVRLGVPVVPMETAAVDAARGRPAALAVVPLDHAARLIVARHAASSGVRHAVHDRSLRSLAGRVLEAAWRDVYGWPGTRVVRDLLSEVEPASESPFESMSRLRLVDRGVERPRCGARVRGASGAYYWADFLWPGARLIGEADGTTKYGLSLEDRQAELNRQWRRQADLEQAGFRVVRWGPEVDWDGLARRLSDALSRSGDVVARRRKRYRGPARGVARPNTGGNAGQRGR